MEKKTPKFNLVDVLAVAFVVLLAVVVLWKVMGSGTADVPDGSGSTDAANDVHVTYVVRAEGRPAELYENVKKYIPSQLMASGELYDAWVVAVEKEPYRILTADGTWVEDPARVNLLFTVEADIPGGDVMTTEVATQEIRVGRPAYILKTEYIELRDTVVVDVQWENWDFGAGREEKK